MSTLIQALGYDFDTATLGVQFHGGTTYHYPGVTPAVYAGLTAAKSLGAHFAAHIRPHYAGVKQGETAAWIKGVPRG